MEQSKVCTRCGVRQPLEDFYVKKVKAGSYITAACKACLRREMTARRAADPAENRARQRAYQDGPEAHARALESKARSRERNRERIREQERQSRQRHPAHAKARQEANRAIESGRLVRELCLFCGNPDTQAHHHSYAPEDWLSVTWLCTKHHGLAHRKVDEPVE